MRGIIAAAIFILSLTTGGLAMAETRKATFAGGCFWCMVPPFENLPGVSKIRAGYTGGKDKTPTYEEVSAGTSGHAEAVQVTFDPSKVSYDQLLDAFWRNIDPTTVDQQFADRGSQYRTAIFYHDPEQKKLAESSRDKLAKSGKFGKPIVTSIEPATDFYDAEEYHQDYHKKNPLRYNMYKAGSGRAGYIEKMWGKEKEKK
jgi:methionine-S-sulfoxide reductase